MHTSLRAPERLTQRQREILLEFARLGEEGREGTVDGMEDEGPEAHKYSKAIVVEPKYVLKIDKNKSFNLILFYLPFLEKLIDPSRRLQERPLLPEERRRRRRKKCLCGSE